MKKTYIAPEVQTLELFEESAVMLAGSINADAAKTTDVVLSNDKVWGPKSIWEE